ncbi:MAG: DUF2007 domain-containing protein [Ignavibacteria bacterium]|nr:DUF2007 domain-containing protein [Ignavibacteria bacterium]
MGLLRDNGVEASLADEANVSWYPGATSAYGGVRVMVRGGDVERALEILSSPLEQDADHGIDVESRGIDIQCPECGSRMVYRRSSFNLFFSCRHSLIRSSTEVDNTMMCEVCNHRWEEE